jgi:hypothetical protein
VAFERRILFQSNRSSGSLGGAQQNSGLLGLRILEKGKPVARLGRKAMGRSADEPSGRQAAEGVLVA